MSDQDLALVLTLLPVVGLTIAYAVYAFRYGNVEKDGESGKISKAEIERLREELTALRIEVGALRSAISSLDRDYGRTDPSRE